MPVGIPVTPSGLFNCENACVFCAVSYIMRPGSQVASPGMNASSIAHTT